MSIAIIVYISFLFLRVHLIDMGYVSSINRTRARTDREEKNKTGIYGESIEVQKEKKSYYSVSSGHKNSLT